MQRTVNHKVQFPTDWRSRLPVIKRRSAELTRSERSLTIDVAKSIIAAGQRLAQQSFFEPYARTGLGNTPFVFVGDPSEIPLLARHAADPFEYRLSMLAGEGDMVIIGGKRNRDFEKYVEQHLGLGHRNYLQVDQPHHANTQPAAVRCLKNTRIYASLLAKIEKLDGATLVPHITTGTIWALARKLGKDAGKLIKVCGPLPTLSNLANNKLWFTRVVYQLFGAGAIPDRVSAYGPAALAARVHSLARNCSKLVVKVPDSAGSEGNFPIISSEISGKGLKQLHHHLLDVLSKTNGQSHYPLMVQVWDNNVLSSPSAQLWIPHPAEGPPVIEGIFEQRVTAMEGHFTGAVSACLPDRWDQKLTNDALMLGYVFQKLGYFGRCSFDTVIFGEDFGSAKLHWIECNGRWGGVSVPMTFLNQLFEGGTPPPYIIVQSLELALPYRSFSAGLEVLKDLLWCPGSTQGVIFMTPSGFEEGASLQFLSLAATAAQADAQAEKVIQRLTNVH